MTAQSNVHGAPLAVCSLSPPTGWNRNGYCEHRRADGGRHLVCAEMTDEFLNFTRERGNDLTGAVRAGDRWCVCAGRYAEAANAGRAPPVLLAATNERALPFMNTVHRTRVA